MIGVKEASLQNEKQVREKCARSRSRGRAASALARIVTIQVQNGKIVQIELREQTIFSNRFGEIPLLDLLVSRGGKDELLLHTIDRVVAHLGHARAHVRRERE